MYPVVTFSIGFIFKMWSLFHQFYVCSSVKSPSRYSQSHAIDIEKKTFRIDSSVLCVFHTIN